MIPVNSTASSANSLAVDVKDLTALRQSARNGSPEALKAAAKQFEALFMNMVMKSMRDASPQDGIFDSEQGKMYTSMLDQQISQNLAKRGVGLADVLVRQLSNTVHPQAAGVAGTSDTQTQSGSQPPALVPGGETSAADLPRATSAQSNVQAFQDRLAAHADEASRITGIPAKFMLGQAALETGWGKHEIRGQDGTPSHNLFGIKAGPGWTGKVAQAVTTEYVGGVAQTRVEKFRAYDSYGESFRDYANMLRSNPRYEQVLASAGDSAGFAHGLQRAGYATDPLYAAKLTRIINQTLTI